MSIPLVAIDDLLAKFTAWARWTERSKLTLVLPGLYMLAEFNDQAPNGLPTLSSKLVYIGETCDQSLYGRLYQFNRSGFLGKPAHSGGARFSEIFGPNHDSSRLFVSVMGVDLSEPCASAFIRYAERALLLAHVQRFGEYPACNRK